MAQWFATGGLAMWVVLLLLVGVLVFDVVTLVLAVAGRFGGGVLLWTARSGAALSLLLSALPGAVGALGWWYARGQVDLVLTVVDPAQREVLRQVGYAEALVPLQFGGGASALLVLVALLACVIAFPPSRIVEEEP